MYTIMIDFKMNLSAVGIDGLIQLGFDSDARRQCIDDLSIGKIGWVAWQLSQVIVTPIGSHVPKAYEKKYGQGPT